jgi:gentisate 1,2-dioxygenase
MTGPTQDELAHAPSLDELYRDLATVSMGPGWAKKTPSLWPSPANVFEPAHWQYAQARGALDAAGRLISTELAERRNLILANPRDANGYGTTATLVAAYQMILPGETARAHRHTPNALRLVVDAEPGTYTVVNGQRLPMLPGDVVLTPNWSWHGHGNDSDAAAYWIDFLDVPLVQMLEPMFFEPHPKEFESGNAPRTPSPLCFPWKETQERLAAANPDPGGRYGIQVQLGHPALDTMALFMMRLTPEIATSPYRTTANNIYAVVDGEGVTELDDRRIEWRRGDVFAVPSWRTHAHRAPRDAVLFRVSDEPLMKKLGFLRSEPT